MAIGRQTKNPAGKAGFPVVVVVDCLWCDSDTDLFVINVIDFNELAYKERGVDIAVECSDDNWSGVGLKRYTGFWKQADTPFVCKSWVLCSLDFRVVLASHLRIGEYKFLVVAILEPYAVDITIIKHKLIYLIMHLLFETPETSLRGSGA